jgi:hypothetical protein
MDSQRRFFCSRCTQVVVICQRCDRGQRYCSAECSRAARRDSHRAANRRYQATDQGRLLHATRQKQYRLRRGPTGVTDQGPQISLVSKPARPLQRSCPVCSAPQSAFLRVDFVITRRRKATKSAAHRRKTALFDSR